MVGTYTVRPMDLSWDFQIHLSPMLTDPIPLEDTLAVLNEISTFGGAYRSLTSYGWIGRY